MSHDNLKDLIHQEGYYAVYQIKPFEREWEGRIYCYNYAIVLVSNSTVEAYECVLPNAISYCKAFNDAFTDHMMSEGTPNQVTLN